MNKNAYTKEVIFAIFVGGILTYAIWWVVGGWVMPILLCGVDNHKQCDPSFVNTLSVAVSALIAGGLTFYNIRKIRR